METEFCMKCGRELKPGAVYCDGCLAEMENYPVKPGIVVLLPNQHSTHQKQPQRRKYPAVSPEEQLVKLKKRIKALWLALILTLAAAAALGWYTVTDLLEDEEIRFLPGQNYSSQTSSESTDPK